MDERFAYQCLTNTGHWATLSQHYTSGAAQERIDRSRNYPQRVIERVRDGRDPLLVILYDPRPLYVPGFV